MSEQWHKESYVAEQESLSRSISSMSGDVQQSKSVTSRVVTENLNLYITPNGSDVSGDGTQAKPFFSLNRCVEYINTRIMSIADGGRAYINCAAGVYDYSAEEQSVRCYKPGLRVIIQGARFNDVSDIYNQLITKINNSEQPYYEITADGTIEQSVADLVKVVSQGEITQTESHFAANVEQVVHAGDIVTPVNTETFVQQSGATIKFRSKRTEFQLGENIMWISRRTTDCSLFDIRLSNTDEADTYVLGLQEVFCNEFKRVEIYAKGWGGIQISETKVSQMQDVVIVNKGSNQGAGLVVDRRSDVTMMQSNTVDGFGMGISVSNFSLLKSQPVRDKCTVCKNCTTGLYCTSVSKAEVRPNNGPIASGIQFENCTTDMTPSTTETWSQHMGYIS